MNCSRLTQPTANIISRLESLDKSRRDLLVDRFCAETCVDTPTLVRYADVKAAFDTPKINNCMAATVEELAAERTCECLVYCNHENRAKLNSIIPSLVKTLLR